MSGRPESVGDGIVGIGGKGMGFLFIRKFINILCGLSLANAKFSATDFNVSLETVGSALGKVGSVN